MDHHSQGSSKVKKALQETVKLDDERYGYVITELIPIGCVPRWHCHVCGKTISSERALLNHLSHPIHKSNLRVPKHPANNFKKFSSSPTIEENTNDKDPSWSDVATDILPGEPVPPGMEDIVEGVCQIQKTLDSFKAAPLIGLEYIVELVSSTGEGEPRYACLLCEKRGDPRSVMLHLTSQNHYLKYISCFFRSAGNALNMLQRTPEIRKGIYVAINKVAEEIEKNYGRLKPTSAIAETFSAKKYEILREIDEKEHFRETPSTAFLHLVDINKIKQYAAEEEQRLQSQVKKVADVPILTSKYGGPKYPQFSKGFPPLKPLESLPPLKNPHQKVPPPLINPPKIVPPPLVNVQKNLSAPSLNNSPQNQPNSSPNKQNNSCKTTNKGPQKSEKKLAFQIGKPAKSLGRNNKLTDQQKQAEQKKESNKDDEENDDDDVIFVEDEECIEVKSLSSISSVSDNDSLGRDNSKRKGKSPYNRYRRNRSPEYRSRRRSPSYSNYVRSRRSRSRSRERYRDRGYRRSHSRRRYSEEREKRRDYTPERSYERRRFSPRRRERSPDRRRSKTIETGMNRESEEQKKMITYRAELKKLEMEYDEKLKYYEDRPEKHPSYSEEWKNFWNRRYKEIQQSGKDPSTYDFKPEWIVFWGKRMKEINDDEFNKKKEDLTKEMGIKNMRGPSSDLQDISPPTPEESRDVTVDDIRNTWKALTGSEISAPPEKCLDKYSSSWDESENPYYDKLSKKKVIPNRSTHFTISPPVVHCLRTLAVLENQLGSLGPKALDLLARALSLERTKPNESMTLLDDQDIHIFFDTVKEKIRGQLLAGIVERGLVNSCYSVIGAIDNMLRTHSPKPRLPPQNLQNPLPTLVQRDIVPPAQPISEPVQVPGIGMVDKIAVAQQIAGALVAQGKTDLSQEELEDLINAVVGIARASNAIVSQDTSTADFFSQLNMKNSTATSHINEILGNMISTVQKNANVSTGTAQTSGTPINTVPPIEIPAMTSGKTPLVNNKDVLSNVQGGYESDEKLKEKLINFSNLCREEQQELIAMLKDLESTQPSRVEGLRKYVSIGLTKKGEIKTIDEHERDEPPAKLSRLSPFSSRIGNSNPSHDEELNLKEINSKNIPSDDDDDDDDYSFEDVYKAASEKLNFKEAEFKKNISTHEDGNYPFGLKMHDRVTTPEQPQPQPRVSQTSDHNLVASEYTDIHFTKDTRENKGSLFSPEIINSNMQTSTVGLDMFSDNFNCNDDQQPCSKREDYTRFTSRGSAIKPDDRYMDAYNYRQNWQYDDIDNRGRGRFSNAQHQYTTGNQNYPTQNFNQVPPRNSGNYYGDQY
ncbi:uncharacterized protein LOC106669237 isoform X2 [Cimex lectularius]|uniref:C2H2-type domain-containing protein n=1 Tax=Cimex lectularius TaxID=79782 RepID=A0A8I6RZB5_CIMLE|nr:uncharacterized protein LOC106669237 isoform X2 [Cimex lectularius]